MAESIEEIIARRNANMGSTPAKETEPANETTEKEVKKIEIYPKKSSEPKINFDENVTIYEVDDVNNAPDLADLPDDERKEIVDFNDKFIREVLEPQLLAYAAPCECQQNKILARHFQRCKLMNKNPQTEPIFIGQEEIDSSAFGVVINSHNNKYVGASCIVKECKGCHKITIWGDAGVITHMIATGTQTSMNFAEEIKAAYGDNVTLEPVDDEGGEAQSADGIEMEAIESMPLSPIE